MALKQIGGEGLIITLESLRRAIALYNNTLPIDERISLIEKQIIFTMKNSDYLSAMKYVKNLIELLFNKINEKHCYNP